MYLLLYLFTVDRQERGPTVPEGDQDRESTANGEEYEPAFDSQSAGSVRGPWIGQHVFGGQLGGGEKGGGGGGKEERIVDFAIIVRIS